MALALPAIGFADVRSGILPSQSDRRCAASGMTTGSCELRASAPPPSGLRPPSPQAGEGQHMSAERAMAVLVFLAGAARTGIVAADFGAFANDGCRGGDRADLLAFALGARLRHRVVAGGLRVLEIHRAGRGLAALLGFHRGDFFLAADAHARKRLHQFLLD